MRQVVINIPEKKYPAFIDHIKSRFADISIKEQGSTSKKKGTPLRKLPSESSLLSEISLSEDWLSDDDNRWDDVL